MSNPYHEAIDTMERRGVDPEYINGWASGFLRNPKREEQRVTDAYDAGYSAGEEKRTDGFESWIRK